MWKLFANITMSHLQTQKTTAHRFPIDVENQNIGKSLLNHKDYD